MTVELITRREDLAPIGRRWDELALKDPRDGFFRSSIWYRAWLDHIRPDAEPFVIVVRSEDGDLVGLAPLCRARYCDLGFALTGVMPGGRDVVSGDFLDFVSEPAAKMDVAAAVFRFIEDNASRWSLFILGELLEGGDSHFAAARLPARYGWKVRVQEERLCPYIELPRTFDQYLGGLTSSTRYHIRRRTRDLERIGATIEVHSTPDDIVDRLETLIQLHIGRWRRDNMPGTLGRSGFAAFLKQVCAAAAANSGCRLYILNHDGAAAAALLTFYFGHSALYYQAGWDPESPVAQYSPGVVVMARSIRDAIEDGFRYYEFLRGDEEYKFRWTKTYRKTVTALFAQNAMARSYLYAAGLKDAFKHWFLSSSPEKMQTGPALNSAMAAEKQLG